MTPGSGIFCHFVYFTAISFILLLVPLISFTSRPLHDSNTKLLYDQSGAVPSYTQGLINESANAD